MKSISASRQKINGTAAERAAMDTHGLNPKDSYFETDTGLRYIWDGDSWEQRIFGGSVILGVGTALTLEDGATALTLEDGATALVLEDA